MTALVQTLSRLSAAEGESDTLKIVLVFSGAGVLVSLLFAIYGLDLGTGLL